MTIAKLTPKQRKTLSKITEAFESSDESISLDEMINVTRLSKTVILNAFEIMGNVGQDETGYYLKSENEPTAEQPTVESVQDDSVNTQATHVSSPVNESAPQVNPSDINTDDDQSNTSQAVEVVPVTDDSVEGDEMAVANQATVKQKRNKPFTPNLTRGYEVQRDKVKIFLDRKASSKVLTLSLEDLKELVNAVEKSERVA